MWVQVPPPRPRSVAQRQEANALGALQCGFESLHSDQRIYFATRLKRANSTNIAAEFRASQVKQALHAAVAQLARACDF